MRFKEIFKNRKFWIVIGCTFLVVKSVGTIYHNKTESWHERSKATFEEALQQEMQKRDFAAITYSEGKVNSKEKYNLFSSIFAENPLDADSLNRAWREALYNTNILVKTIVRVTVSEGEGKESLYYSQSAFEPLAKDSLFSFYMGPHREVEVTGFVSYHWWNVLDGRLPIMIILLLAAYVLPGFLLVKMFQMRKQSLLKKQTPAIESEKMDKIIVKAERTSTYQLEEDVFYDADLRILKRKEDTEKLTPQQGILLEAFLKAKQYKLTQREIDTLLWADGSGTVERLYTAVCRLRKSLERISSFQVDCQIDIYQLKQVHSIKQNEPAVKQTINKLDDEELE